MVMRRVMLYALAVFAAGMSLASGAAEEIEISSDSLQYAQDNQEATFIGNVSLKMSPWHLLAVSVRASGGAEEAGPSLIEAFSDEVHPVRLYSHDTSLRAGGLKIDRQKKVIELTDDVVGRFDGVSITLSIAAESGYLYEDEQKLIHLSGMPVSLYWTGTEDDAPTEGMRNRAIADAVYYDLTKKLLRLRGAVSLSFGGDVLVGDSVDYYVETGKIDAKDDSTGGRVTIRLGTIR